MRSIDNKLSGFTLIEMLVGIVIGMIVVAAASVMMVMVLKSQKDITASVKLNQELGTVMAVMSNEIRRAGFRVCDIKKMHDAGSNCPLNPAGEEVPYIRYNTSATDKDLEIFDVNGDDPPHKGDCILYRYNADLNDSDDLGEQRGFRLFVKLKDPNIPNDKDRHVFQIARPVDDVKCDDPHDFTDPTSNKWENFTDPNVIRITALSFSTTGSKCRNMSGNFYWVVGVGATGLACDVGTNLDTSVGCVDLNDPPDSEVKDADCKTSATAVMSKWITGEFVTQPVPTPVPPLKDVLFGVDQIRINLQATLTRDSTVSKNMKTSVKVANPWIRLR
jgi:type IV pilus assembly protein PilW